MGANAGRMDPSSEPTTPSASSGSSVTTAEPPSNRNSPLSDDSAFPSVKHKRLGFETPREDQRVTLMDMPEEILMEIIMHLDADSLSKCYRVCKHINSFMSDSSAVSLRHALLANSLRLNPHALKARPDMPHQVPKSSVSLLAQLRERLTRLQNLSPSMEKQVPFREAEGRLYEYLEGVLLRSPVDLTLAGPHATYSRDLAVYDFRKPDEWEEMTVDGSVNDDDVDEVVEETETSDLDSVRMHHRSSFVIHELAVDPGQDLLLLATSGARDRGTIMYCMEIHLLSLSTFKPHPRAQVPVLTFHPTRWQTTSNLEFQICDDSLFVLRKQTVRDMALPRVHVRIPDQLVGWQWTTGRMCMELTSAAKQELQSFQLLTPTSFIVTAYRAVAEVDDAHDLEFSHHLDLYAFPRFDTLPQDTERRWRPTCIKTFDLPRFTTDLRNNILPPQMSVRVEPPPRQNFPQHPLHAPPPFVPDPATGVVLVSVRQQLLNLEVPDEGETLHFMFVFPKPLLISHMPQVADYEERLSRNSLIPPLAATISAEELAELWADVPRSVSWAELAPHVRALGPRHPQAEWVCYVYQNRYVTVEDVLWSPEADSDSDDGHALVPHLCAYDFDAHRVQKEINDRLGLLESEGKLSGDRAKDLADVEGDWDGIQLVLAPDEHEKGIPLDEAVSCGQQFPYLITRKECEDETIPLIDAERILAVCRPDMWAEDNDFGTNHGSIKVMNF